MIWRASLVAGMLGLWLAAGIAWGPRAALLFAFPVFNGCVLAAWANVAGRMDQRAAAWYYERQLNECGRWRGRASRRFADHS
jgi:hypothetical protein